MTHVILVELRQPRLAMVIEYKNSFDHDRWTLSDHEMTSRMVTKVGADVQNTN